MMKLKKSINLIKQKGWIPCSRYHYGAIELTLEKLLKIKTFFCKRLEKIPQNRYNVSMLKFFWRI